MRRLVQNLNRRSLAPAILAGAAASFTLAPSARSQQPQSATLDELAFAIPRVGVHGSLAEVNLPTPLGPADVSIARRIFADQIAGRFDRVAHEQGELTSHILDGTILAARYLGPRYTASPAELRDWLARFSDEADCAAIVGLLRRREPSSIPAALRMPDALPPEGPEDSVSADLGRAAVTPVADRPTELAVQSSVHRQEYASALRLIEGERLAAPAAQSLRAEVARGLFTQNLNSAALEIATGAWRAAPANQRLGRVALLAGLAAWRLDLWGLAAQWFADAARAPISDASVRAASAFWAGRAALRAHDLWGYRNWLQQAASERRTFYGLIARRILGWGTGLNLGRDILSQADLDALSERTRAVRAFALIQVGQRARAEGELRALWPEIADSAPLRRALLLVAANAHMPDLTAQLAELVQQADGVPHDALRFPVPRLSPVGGFTVDPALVYGVTRTESNFRPTAVSSAGASGLMQLTPAAARSVTGNPRLTEAALHNPGLNLGVGQKLLLDLAGRPAVQGDLIRLLAAYNAGLGNVAAWNQEIRAGGDPLLFIEAIPITETRQFVGRVLTNTWIYAARLGLPATGLDDLAAGRTPQLLPVRPHLRDELRPAGAVLVP